MNARFWKIHKLPEKIELKFTETFLIQFLQMLLAFIPGGFYEVTLLSLIFGFDVAFVAFHHSIRVILVFLLLPLAISKKQY